MSQMAAQFAEEEDLSENSREELISLEAEAQKVEALRQQISDALAASGVPTGAEIEMGSLPQELQEEIDEMSVKMVDKMISMFQSGVSEEVLMEQFGDHISGVIGELLRNKSASKKLQKKMEELQAVIEAARQKLSSKVALEGKTSYETLTNLKTLNSMRDALKNNLQKMSEKSTEINPAQLRQGLLKTLETMKSLDARLKDMQKQLQQKPENLSIRDLKQQLSAIREALKTANPEQQAALRQQQSQVREQLARAREQQLQRQLKSVENAMKTATGPELQALRQQQSVIQQQLRANQQEQALRQQLKSLQENMKNASKPELELMRQQQAAIKQQLNGLMREQVALRQMSQKVQADVLNARLQKLNEAMKTANPEQMSKLQADQARLSAQLKTNMLRQELSRLRQDMKDNPSKELRDQINQVRNSLRDSQREQAAIRQREIEARMQRLKTAAERTQNPATREAMLRDIANLQSRMRENQMRGQILDAQRSGAQPDKMAALNRQIEASRQANTIQEQVAKTNLIESINSARIANLNVAKSVISGLQSGDIAKMTSNLGNLEKHAEKMMQEAQRSGDRQAIREATKLTAAVEEVKALSEIKRRVQQLDPTANVDARQQPAVQQQQGANGRGNDSSNPRGESEVPVSVKNGGTPTTGASPANQPKTEQPNQPKVEGQTKGDQTGSKGNEKGGANEKSDPNINGSNSKAGPAANQNTPNPATNGTAKDGSKPPTTTGQMEKKCPCGKACGDEVTTELATARASTANMSGGSSLLKPGSNPTITNAELMAKLQSMAAGAGAR